MAGSPHDAIAVGDHGYAAHLDAAGHTRIECGEEMTSSLRAVVRADAIAWAVGEHGVVVRLDAQGCTVERAPDPAAPTLLAIGIGVHGRPFAVGDEGACVERDASGAWQASDLDAGRSSLRGVERIERYVYLVGTGGAILRRIVVDGT